MYIFILSVYRKRKGFSIVSGKAEGEGEKKKEKKTRKKITGLDGGMGKKEESDMEHKKKPRIFFPTKSVNEYKLLDLAIIK